MAKPLTAEYFSEKMSQLMQEKELTLSELAKKADLPESTLKNYKYTYAKDGILTVPSVVIAAQIANALNTSVDELIGTKEIHISESDIYSLPKVLSLLALIIRFANLQITSKNPYIQRFLLSLSKIATLPLDVYKEEANAIADSYSSLIFYKGTYLLKEECLDLLRLDFLYGDCTKEIQDDFPDENREAIAQRNEMWDEALKTRNFSFLKQYDHLGPDDYAFLNIN